MMWKQRKWANGVEESYSHLVYAVLEDARSRNNNRILHVENTFTDLRYHCHLKQLKCGRNFRGEKEDVRNVIYLISTKAEHSLGEIKNSSVCCCSIDLGTKLRLKKVNAYLRKKEENPSRLFEQYPFLSLFKQKNKHTIHSAYCPFDQ